MNIIVRNEEQGDFRRVETIAREAFWNLYFPGAYEHFVIHLMRNHPDFIKELAFVIEVDGEVEGAIFYTHSKIVSENGAEYKTISFGPVCISPKYHRQGFGRALITHSIQVAKNMNFSAIITYGYPYHYKPYGFVGGKTYNIMHTDGKYHTGLLALPLYDGAFDGVSGTAVVSDVFDVQEEAVNDFDKLFPYKEKSVLPCQELFEKACLELDE